MAIKIVVDSGSDINLKEAEALGIEMLPMTISFDDQDYYDGVDLLPVDFYEKLEASKNLPKTSQVNPYRYREKFKELVKNGDKVICICLSSRLSGTYLSACSAACDFENQVYVVDSKNAIVGQRFLCMRALELIKQGCSIEEIVEILEHDKTRLKVLGIIDTLEYLKKGGRVSAVAAAAGEILSIKPVIMVIDGEVQVVGKPIGSKKATLFLKNIVNKTKGIDFNMPYAIIWTGKTNEKVAKFQNDTASLWNGLENVPSYIIGCTIGTHLGPGGIGIAFFEKED